MPSIGNAEALTPMNTNSGMWVIATTFQGGGVIDEVSGPFWSHDEAESVAAEIRAHALPRCDLIEVYLLTGDFS
jgi:hypothetical protein